MEFKDKLRKIRTESGLSQEALADAVHISRSAIAKYENGNGNPSEDTLKALAVYFGIETDELRSDQAIKKNKKNRVLIRAGAIALAVLLIGGTATGITLGAIGVSNKPSQETEEIVITGIGADMEISKSASGVYKPVESFKDEATQETYYYVNTFLDFDLSIHPVCQGNGTIFIASGRATLIQDQAFSSSYFVDRSGNDSVHRISFKKEGSYTLEYSYLGFESHINFIIDNSASRWDKFKSEMRYVYPWAGQVAKKDIQGLRYEYGNASLGAGALKDVYYSSAADDIEDAYAFLGSKLFRTNKYMEEGNGEKSVLEYTLADSPSRRIVLAGDQLGYEDGKYLVEKPFNRPTMYSEHRHAFNECGSDIEAVNLLSQEEVPFPTLYELEFGEWPSEEGYEKSDPVYAITGYPTEISVYASNRFGFNEKMYKVLSAQDFSPLFE